MMMMPMTTDRIAFINGNLSRQASRDKLEGYKKCLTDAEGPSMKH